MRSNIGLILAAFCLLWFPCSTQAGSISTVVESIGGVQAILLTPMKPRGAMVLLSGGQGEFAIDAQGETRSDNSLVRNRRAFAERGFAVLVPEGSVDLKVAIDFMRRFGHVTLVATSRGTQRAAHGIALGARPDRLVLTSGVLSNASGNGENVVAIVVSPERLPQTLIVHHRHDSCFLTLPAGVDPFMAWAAGKARVTWLDGGTSVGKPCEARAYHGFNGIDDQMIAAVAGFAAR